MKKITPFLWFDDNAEEAMKFYMSIFKDSKILKVNKRNGKVLTANFRLNGQDFIALNGGPRFKFTPAISFCVHCKDQREINSYWKKLSAGGSPGCCGWLTDRYGLSWQIVPTDLKDLWNGDAARTERVWDLLMNMTKIEIRELKRAARGRKSTR